jgi:hypothetical protein
METSVELSQLSDEELNEYIKKRYDELGSVRKVGLETGIDKSKISRVLKKLKCETTESETLNSVDGKTVSKTFPADKSHETVLDLTDDEQLVYDYLREISPLVARLGNLPKTKVDINKVLLSLQSKVNKGFTLNQTTKVYEGESIDALVCGQFRYRNSCLGCEPTLGSFGVDVDVTGEGT